LKDPTQDPVFLMKNQMLLEAAFSGDSNEVKRLIKEGADINCKSIEGDTPLSEAALKGKVEVCNIILELGYTEVDVNNANSEFRTPLHKAAFNGNAEVIELLLKNGADPRRFDANGNLPIDYSTNN
jgi:ankyrin repeat protein